MECNQPSEWVLDWVLDQPTQNDESFDFKDIELWDKLYKQPPTLNEKRIDYEARVKSRGARTAEKCAKNA